MMPFKYEFEHIGPCWCGCQGGRLLPDDRIQECTDCQTVTLCHRLTEESSRKFYESGDYRRWVRGYATITQEDFDKGYRRGKEIQSYLSSHGVYPQTVYEIGCGAGGILSVFANSGVVATGHDADRRCISYPSSTAVHDLMILSHLLEHLYDPLEPLLSDRFRFAYIETPAWKVGTVLQLPHLFYFTPQSICLMASRANLEIVAMDDSIRAILRRKHA